MTAQPDLQAFTEKFYETIQGQLAVNQSINELLADAETIAAGAASDSPAVLDTLRALKKANTSGPALLAILEVAKRNAFIAQPSLGPATICPAQAQVAKAA